MDLWLESLELIIVTIYGVITIWTQKSNAIFFSQK